MNRFTKAIVMMILVIIAITTVNAQFRDEKDRARLTVSGNIET